MIAQEEPREVSHEPHLVQTAVVPTADGTQYLTLSADQEPMRLDSLCVACMKNVRCVSSL